MHKPTPYGRESGCLRLTSGNVLREEKMVLYFPGAMNSILLFAIVEIPISATPPRSLSTAAAAVLTVVLIWLATCLNGWKIGPKNHVLAVFCFPRKLIEADHSTVHITTFFAITWSLIRRILE